MGLWREKLTIQKDNPIAGMCPLAKLCMLGLYFIIVITVSTARLNGYPAYTMAAAAIPVLLAAASGITRGFLRGFKNLCALAVVIVAAQALLFPGPEILWGREFFGVLSLNIYEAGSQKGLTLGSLALSLGGGCLWFFGCTEGRELVRACEKKGMSPKIGYVLLSAARMIPATRRAARRVMDAQEARGMETRGNFTVRLRALAPCVIPLVLNAVHTAGERALALEAKGFSARCQKTRLLDVRENGREWRALIFSALAACAALVWRLALWTP